MDKYDDYFDEDETEEKETDNLPTLYNPRLITLQPFKPVTETSDDRETTEADLNHLNNHLAICDAAIPKANTIASLCMLSNAVCKLIEVRRKVKKLGYGEPAKAGSGRVFEVLE